MYTVSVYETSSPLYRIPKEYGYNRWKNKMKRDKNKETRGMIVNLIWGLLVVIFGFLAFRIFSTLIEYLLYPVIFFLVLIYLEILNKG